MKRFADKAAVITGGSSGIGFATVQEALPLLRVGRLDGLQLIAKVSGYEVTYHV